MVRPSRCIAYSISALLVLSQMSFAVTKDPVVQQRGPNPANKDTNTAVSTAEPLYSPGMLGNVKSTTPVPMARVTPEAAGQPEATNPEAVPGGEPGTESLTPTEGTEMTGQPIDETQVIPPMMKSKKSKSKKSKKTKKSKKSKKSKKTKKSKKPAEPAPAAIPEEGVI